MICAIAAVIAAACVIGMLITMIVAIRLAEKLDRAEAKLAEKDELYIPSWKGLNLSNPLDKELRRVK
jgi:hypothetical protein